MRPARFGPGNICLPFTVEVWVEEAAAVGGLEVVEAEVVEEEAREGSPEVTRSRVY